MCFDIVLHTCNTGSLLERESIRKRKQKAEGWHWQRQLRVKTEITPKDLGSWRARNTEFKVRKGQRCIHASYLWKYIRERKTLVRPAAQAAQIDSSGHSSSSSTPIKET